MAVIAPPLTAVTWPKAPLPPAAVMFNVSFTAHPVPPDVMVAIEAVVRPREAVAVAPEPVPLMVTVGAVL